MSKQRTGGMTAIGILNIIFGALGAIMSLLLIVGAGFITAVGTSGMASESQASGSGGAGGLLAAGGIIFMIVGLVMLCCTATLLVSGIGVLKMASWGRTLSIVCGGVLAALSVIQIIGGDFSLGTIAGLAYGCLLVGVFMKPEWKAAFSAQPATQMTAQPSYQSSHDQMRHAA